MLEANRKSAMVRDPIHSTRTRTRACNGVGGAMGRDADHCGPGFVLTIRALSSDIPPEIRLRRLLKAALRSFGFQCVAVERDGTAKACERGQR